MNNIFKESFTWLTQWWKFPITKIEITLFVALSLMCFLILFWQQRNHPELTSATSLAGILSLLFLSLKFFETEYKKMPRYIIWTIMAIVILIVVVNLVLINTLPEEVGYTPNYPSHILSTKILSA